MPPVKEGLAKVLAASVREYVGNATSGFKSDIETLIREFKGLEQRIASIPHGPKGDKGEPGESIKGEPGRDGIDGKNGRDGIDGKDGAPGQDGKSIVGPSGKDGLNGKDGRDGIDGKNGIDGASITGERGKDGIDGKDGRDGRDGINGKDGRDGERGLDALQLDILPGIDPAKSYLRGTYARHNGGLVRFKENEWEVIVDGLASIDFEDCPDSREIKIIFTRTSGAKTVLNRRLPLLTYRQIWTDGERYQRGDVVTWSGSAWHCEAEATTQKPGTGNDWTLMVKEGRRGKDAELPKEPTPPKPVSLK